MTPRFVDREKLTTPETGYVVYVDYWWWENSDGKILTHYKVGAHWSLQTNSQQSVLSSLQANHLYAGLTPVQLPVAFIHRIYDQ